MDTIKTYSCVFYFAIKAKHNGKIDYYNNHIIRHVKAKTLEQARQKFSDVYKELYEHYMNNLKSINMFDGWISYTDKTFDIFLEERKITIIHLFGHIVKDSIKVKTDYSKESVEYCQEHLTVSEYNELLKDLGAINCPLLK